MASLAEELGALKPTQLRRRATASGVPEEAIEEAEDGDSPKATLIELILAAAAPLQAELAALKPTELRKRAKVAGASAEAIDEAEDSDSPKEALISLILAAKQSGAVAGGGPAMAGAAGALMFEIAPGAVVTVGRQIAKGGSGFVFAGTLVEGGHSQEVAVKTIADGAQPNEMAAFRKELATLGRIASRCDGVCKMFGSAEHAGQLFLVMKRYASSLDEHLRQTGPLDALKVIELGLQITHTVCCPRIRPNHTRRPIHQSAHSPNHPLLEPQKAASATQRGSLTGLARVPQLVSLHGQQVIVKDLKPGNVLVEVGAGGAPCRCRQALPLMPWRLSLL